MNTDQLRLVTQLKELAERLSTIKDPDSDLDYEDLDGAVEELEEDISFLETASEELDESEEEDDGG